MEIDTTLFSNQLGTYGMETMKKIQNLSVFIYGMRGVYIIINLYIVRCRNCKEYHSLWCEENHHI